MILYSIPESCFVDGSACPRFCLAANDVCFLVLFLFQILLCRNHIHQIPTPWGFLHHKIPAYVEVHLGNYHDRTDGAGINLGRSKSCWVAAFHPGYHNCLDHLGLDQTPGAASVVSCLYLTTAGGSAVPSEAEQNCWRPEEVRTRAVLSDQSFPCCCCLCSFLLYHFHKKMRGVKTGIP